MTQVKCLDVSSNNHEYDQPIDWAEVFRQGYRAVIIKATQGIDYVNPWLKEDATKAFEAGFKYIGYYHFAISRASSAIEQANYFAQHIAGLPRNIGGSLDQETQDNSWLALSNWSHEFLSRLEDLFIGPKLYSNNNFLSNMDDAPYGYPLWLASPGIRPRRNVWCWQNSWTAKIAGIPSIDCDTDILYLP